MRWIVGLDLRPTCLGAVNVARWMAQSATASARPRFIGVYVLVRPSRVAVRDDVVDELCGAAADRARAMLREAGALDLFERVEAVPGNEPEETLAAAARYHDADGIIIGRHGPRDRDSIIRLGRVARRLIRNLPVATMVVPPQTEAADLGVGPIVVATDLTEASIAAGRFGLTLSRDFRRDLVLLRAAPTPDGPPPDDANIADSQIADSQIADSQIADSQMDAWIRAYGLGGATSVVVSGDPVHAMLRIQGSRNATMLVCGSRHLSLGQRVFVASTGTDLARESRVPVLIVPPESIARAPG